MPMMVTPLIVGMIFSHVFNPALGIANYLLGLIGVAPVAWFGEPTAAMISILRITVWPWTPFMNVDFTGDVMGAFDEIGDRDDVANSPASVRAKIPAHHSLSPAAGARASSTW
jgi:hypothetical protein